jgi:hypothetical protein
VIEGVLEGIADGEGECSPSDPGVAHSADSDEDFRISLSELLRLVQLFNVGSFSCATSGSSEDGFVPGDGDTTCSPHNSDYASTQDWQIDLSELLRGIQLYNAENYYQCSTQGSEDGYCLYRCPNS